MDDAYSRAVLNLYRHAASLMLRKRQFLVSDNDMDSLSEGLSVALAEVLRDAVGVLRPP